MDILREHRVSVPQQAIRTAQNDVHPRLEEIVRRHLVHCWRSRPHAATDAAFAAVAARVDAARGVPLILDSGCGTGASTRLIAAAFPHAIELLGSGAGTVVPRRNPQALANALLSVLTEPGIASGMACESARLAPKLLWPAVARSYRDLVATVVTATEEALA